jgi:serine/threonine protein kinase/cell division protein FtsB
MAGQAAEQIIAGVVLSERLAVTMYGAIHRASFGGQRNLRGLVVDPKMLEEDAFRVSLTDAKNVAAVTKLEHPNIVPTVTVESGGPDVVIVTRGVGRYVTVQDLITQAKARSKSGKLSLPIAALIGKSVIEALAAAHRAGLIHGAVHPRSVLIDEDGGVRLGDFIAGRALTTAVAQGADSSLWRGLAGYVAPELVVGEDPTPGVDVFAVGAMLFTMLSGEVPPGSLRVTPAVERLVQRALDTDVSRRYKTATDLLENLLEAMEDDRWELAERGELIKEAGLSATDENIDDATEDLLASLGKSDMKVTTRPSSLDLTRPEPPRAQSTGGRLDALLSDLGDETGLTHVDDMPGKLRRDPISDIIRNDPRRRESIVSSSRVPSLDDPDDDDTPLPPAKRPSSDDGLMPQRRADVMRTPPRGATADEAAALAAIGELDSGARRVSTAAEQAAAAAAKLEQAAARAERAARRAESDKDAPRAVRPAATPIVDPIQGLDLPTPKLRSPLKSALGGLVLLGILGGAGYMVYARYTEDEAKAAQQKADRDKQQAEKDALEAKLRAAQPDSGAIDITASGAGIWLRLGRTPLDTPVHLAAGQPHDLVLLKPGSEVTEAQVNGTHWTGAKEQLKAKIAVTMKSSRAKAPPALPLQPTTAVLASTGVVGAGPVHIDSTPSDAEVWLFIGANHAQFNELWAGRDYEVAVVKPGFKTQHVVFKAEDWRDGGDPNIPIDVAKKKPLLTKTVELEPDPDWKDPKKKGK